MKKFSQKYLIVKIKLKVCDKQLRLEINFAIKVLCLRNIINELI